MIKTLLTMESYSTSDILWILHDSCRSTELITSRVKQKEEAGAKCSHNKTPQSCQYLWVHWMSSVNRQSNGCCEGLTGVTGAHGSFLIKRTWVSQALQNEITSLVFVIDDHTGSISAFRYCDILTLLKIHPGHVVSAPTTPLISSLCGQGARWITQAR